MKYAGSHPRAAFWPRSPRVIRPVWGQMDLLTAVVIYCFAVGVFFTGMWLFYGRREQAFFESARRKTTFLCVKCNKLYSASGNPEFRDCPRCGRENARLKY